MEKYIIISIIAGFLLVMFLEQKIYKIIQVKKYYLETQKLLKNSVNVEDKEVYTTLLYMYKSRILEMKKDHPHYYKISNIFKRVDF